MTELLDFSTWSILQWVLVVLAAGFIGQFGKSFAQFLMAKIRARRGAGREKTMLSVSGEGGKTKSETSMTIPAGKGETVPDKSTVLSGKEDPPAPSPGGAYHLRPAGESGEIIPDKKARKAILKQQKKAAKGAAKAAK